MAWENYAWVWNVVGTQGSEYNVLIFLANEAGPNGFTESDHPVEVDKIMRRCNLNRRSVFVHLKKLEQKGFIKREKKTTLTRAQKASQYILQKNVFFPKNGEYSEAAKMWVKVLLELEGKISEADHRELRRSQECFLQKNSRVLYLVTDSNLFEQTLMDNLAAVKAAAISAKLIYTGKSNRPEPKIRRFEAFRKPHVK